MPERSRVTAVSIPAGLYRDYSRKSSSDWPFSIAALITALTRPVMNLTTLIAITVFSRTLRAFFCAGNGGGGYAIDQLRRMNPFFQ
jgi:hypothetical protein